jgi:hypothetical protein
MNYKLIINQLQVCSKWISNSSMLMFAMMMPIDVTIHDFVHMHNSSHINNTPFKLFDLKIYIVSTYNLIKLRTINKIFKIIKFKRDAHVWQQLDPKFYNIIERPKIQKCKTLFIAQRWQIDLLYFAWTHL